MNMQAAVSGGGKGVNGQRGAWLRGAGVLLLLSALAVVGPACSSSDGPGGGGGGGGDIHKTLLAGARVIEDQIRADIASGKAALSLPIERTADGEFSGALEVTLEEMDSGKEVAQVSRNLRFSDARIVENVELTGLDPALAKGDTAGLVIRFRLRDNKGTSDGRRSLFDALYKVENLILSTDKFFAGTASYMRIVSRDPKDGTPNKNAQVTVSLKAAGSSQDIYKGITNDFGMVAAKLAIPADMPAGQGSLMVVIETGKATERLERPITIRREQKLLLTTDKPIYQPGQQMHLRTLALRRPDLKAEAGQDMLFEVSDAKGNKLFKKTIKTNDFGVAGTSFRIAREVNMGAWKVTASLGNTKSEKTVKVERYVLPKFKVTFTPDREFYRPGDTVKALVSANYFFGKPVAGGKVNIKAMKFDVGFETFAELKGVLDKDGQYAAAVKLPNSFVGQPLEQGNAFARFEIEITDLAEQKSLTNHTVSVAEAPIRPLVFAESQYLAHGMDNRFFLITTDPRGAPIKTSNTVVAAGQTLKVDTDAYGVGEFNLQVAPVEAGKTAPALTIEVASSDGKGGQANKRFQIGGRPGQGDAAVRLRANKSLYKVGDTAELKFFVRGNGSERLFLDVIRNNQTLLTETLTSVAGQADYSLDLSEDLAGNLQLFVWFVGVDGDIVRDQKLIFVDSANDLTVKAELDKTTYKPAETAKLRFSITNAKGQGVPAALGLYVVDEAVFALQEVQPGLAQVFFRAEEEIMKPRYQINGWSSSDIYVQPEDDADAKRRERGAEVLSAASGGEVTHGININTHTEAVSTASAKVKARVEKDFAEVRKLYLTLLGGAQPDQASLERFIESSRTRWIDPFGNAYIFESKRGEFNQLEISFLCWGPDEKAGTSDDILLKAQDWQFYSRGGRGEVDDGDFDGAPNAGGPPQAGGGGGGMADAGAAPSPPREPGKAEGEQPRVRSFFPETLYVNPAIITDNQGAATLDLPLADSITTWRMTGMANSAGGALGSYLGGVRVFQDFFVDIDFPVSLTQNDEITVPVAVFNYLDKNQKVTLTAKPDTWYDLLDQGTKSIELKSGEVNVVKFRVKVKKVGWRNFEVTAIGSALSDAVRRAVEVVPDGTPHNASFSARLEGAVEHAITLPPETIEGSSAIVVKVYPGVFSQVVEGLDSILRMPSGCFEQTSSTTFPNVLALNYMRETNKITPAVELKALEYVSQGYQRLLTFEVKGGGFEWFGNDPAHLILTAYGLLEFYEMSKVFTVDPAVISRTQNWLAGLQQSDGSWKPNPNGIHEGATNNFTDSVLRNTAYVTWVLLESGFSGPAAGRGVDYLKQNISKAADNYTRALVANALVSAAKDDPAAVKLLGELDSAKKEKGNQIYWEAGAKSETFTSGKEADIETTALILYAMIKAQSFPNTVSSGLNYLVGNKDSFGNWSSTQATIYSLRALIASAGAKPTDVDASVSVSHNGKVVEEFRITTADADVMRVIDLKDRTIVGANQVKLNFTGKGTFFYQVAGTWWTPWKPDSVIGPEPLSITVAWDKTKLETDDIVTATVKVTNNTKANAEMVMVDLGIPPGFEVVTSTLDEHVRNKLFSKYELTPRQAILYLYKVDAGKPVTFSYQLKAGNPIKGKTPPSKVWAYYNPDQKGDAPPVDIEVTE
ncbi:MAG: hypothetical protein GMKNLPBB_01170 [Myxococcota bacterium]|nr:hypothetical protein [Myxococcota bacterium]